MKIPLKEITEIRTGYPFRERIVSVEGGAYGVIQIRDIDKDGKLSMTSVSRVNMDLPAEHYMGVKGDVLLQNRGVRGIAAVLPAELPNLIVCSHFFIMRPSANVLPEYLAWHINSPVGQGYIKSHRRGSYIPIIPKEGLSEMLVVVPPLEVQRRIVDLDRLAHLENSLLKQITDKKNVLVQALCEKYLENQAL